MTQPSRAYADPSFELKLGDGRVVEWSGKDGLASAQRYAEAHPGETVIAWRHIQHGLFIGSRRIIE